MAGERASVVESGLLQGDIEAGGNITLTAKGGNVDVTLISSSAGNISLTALGTTSDVRIGTVQALAGNVTAFATRSIYDVNGADGSTAYVIANSVTLTAQQGAIGTSTNFLAINSSQPAPRPLTATALH